MKVNAERSRRYKKRTLSRPRQTEWTITERDIEEIAADEEAFYKNLPGVPLSSLTAWRAEVHQWAKAKGVRIEWLLTPNVEPNVRPPSGTVISWRTKDGD